MASPVRVENLFDSGGKSGADDSVTLFAFDVDDVEQTGPDREADGCESLFRGGAGVEIDGMGILEGSSGFEEGDSVLFRGSWRPCRCPIRSRRRLP